MKALAAALIIVALPVQSLAATLTIHVGNIDKRGGFLHVALYTQDLWLFDDATPVANSIGPAVPPVTTVVWYDVPPGIYGIKSYQDANRNDKFDQNIFGLPLERYGFSRDARPFLSEPDFDRTKFTVVDGNNEINIHLQ